MSRILKPGFIDASEMIGRLGIDEVHQKLVAEEFIAFEIETWGDYTPVPARFWSSRSARNGLEYLEPERPLIFKVVATAPHLVRNEDEPSAPRRPPAKRSAGGRPSKYDWEGALIELARLDADSGTSNKTTADLVRHLVEWFTVNSGEHPDEKDIRTRVVRYQEATQGKR